MVSKSQGNPRYVHNFGTAQTDEEADVLMGNAPQWIRSHGGQQELDFENVCGKEQEDTVHVLDNMDAILINGTQLLLNRIYASIGFNQIPDEILRHLVITRVSQPRSKLATVAYLKSYYDEDVDLNHICHRVRCSPSPSSLRRTWTPLGWGLLSERISRL